MRRNQRLAFGFLVAVVGVLLLACPCVPALAQVASPVTQSQESKNSVSDLEHLVLTLQDEGKRDELIQTLQTLIAADRAGVREETPLTLSGRIATALSSSWTATREALVDLGRQASPSLQQLSALPSAFADPARRERNVHATLAFLGVFLVGWLAEAACWKLLIRARRSVRIIGSTTPLPRPGGPWRA